MKKKEIQNFIESCHLLNWEELRITDSVRAHFANNPFFLEQMSKGESEVSAYTYQYDSNHHLVQGFFAEPKGNTEKLPCIILNRGGTAHFGELRTGYFFTGIVSELVRNGYCVFASQYSGGGLSGGKDEFGGADVDDILNLYPIAKSNPSVDSTRIGMYGSSRGAMMAYLSLIRSKWIRAVVCVAGSADLVAAEIFRPEMRAHFKELFGGSLIEKKKRSALYFVDKFPKDVPILLMHGSDDVQVNPSDSLRLSEKFQEFNIPHRLVMFEGDDHFLIKNLNEANNLTVKWFDRFVKKSHSE